MRQVEGFFWCSGPVYRPDLWDYKAIVLDRKRRGANRVREYRGDDPNDLRAKLAHAGLDVPGDLKRLCEAAPISPHPDRKIVGASRG